MPSKNKQQFHKRLILHVILLFTLPLIIFVSLLKLSLEAMPSLYIALFTFTCILLRICLMTTTKYAKKRKSSFKDKKNK